MTEPPFDRASRLTTCFSISGSGGETTDSNGEDLSELFEPAFDPLPTVGETFTKEEGAAHTAVDAVIPPGDREIDEPRTSGSHGEPP
jgi:hypothetical protein